MQVRRGRRAGVIAAALGAAFVGGSSAWAWRAGADSAQEPVFQTVPPAPAGEAGDEKEGRRAVRGRIDFARIREGFSDATVVLTLRRSEIPNGTAPAGKVAEARFFGVSKAAGRPLTIPFTLGDFAPDAGASYSLECFLDVDRSGKLDVGDYWNQRQVRVLSPGAPPVATIQDFAPIVEAR